MTSSASKKSLKDDARTNYWPRRWLRIDKKFKTLRKMRHFSQNWWLVVRRAIARRVARVAVQCGNSSMIRNNTCLSVSESCNRHALREARLNRRSLSDAPSSMLSRSWSARNYSRRTRINFWSINRSIRAETAPPPKSQSPSRVPQSRRKRSRQLWTKFHHANLNHQRLHLHRKWRQKSA